VVAAVPDDDDAVGEDGKPNRSTQLLDLEVKFGVKMELLVTFAAVSPSGAQITKL
jgi:hypothetical protein